MCAKKPKKATGADIQDGTTIDQIIAQKIGQDTLVPSLQLAIEDPGANSSNCGEGYSCAYTNSISWASPDAAAADGAESADRLREAVRRRAGQDSGRARRAPGAGPQHSRFGQPEPGPLQAESAGASDRHKVDEFTDDIREIERRLDIAKKASGVATGENVVVPAGIPESFDEHIKLHFDLTALAFRNDITRVATHALCPRSDRPQLPGQRHQQQLPRRRRTTPRIPTASRIIRRSTAITCSAWRTSWIS